MNETVSRATRIENALRAALNPADVDVVDESHLHEGHAGWRPGGGTHFRVTVISEAFAGLGRVQRQRLVYDALADEIASGLHALAMTTLTPDESASS